MSDTRERIGLIGVGLLGTAIAERLIDAGFRVLACDPDSARLRSLTVEVAPSPQAVAEAVDRCVLCLPDSDVVDEVVFGSDGLVSATRHRVELVLDTTTGDPDRSSDFARRLAEAGVRFVDAPVTGSSVDLRRGRAAVMVGGSDEAIEGARDLLEALSGVTYRMGVAGSGLRAKLASNLLLGLQRLALAESLVFGEAIGIDAATLLEVLRAGPAYSKAMDSKGRKMIERDWSPQARLAQHRKDVRLILEQAEALGLRLSLSDVHASVLDAGIERGFGDLDNSSVLDVLRALRSEQDVAE
ncbi:MAG: NAD(P)-dependent oxidoreductase [Planctomycetota bacterium]